MTLLNDPVTRTDALAGGDAVAWDALAEAAGAPVYSSSSWLRMAERPQPDDAGFTPSYLTVWAPDGTLDGALPAYTDSVPGPELYDPARLFPEVLGDRPWAPGVVAGSRSGYHGRLLLRPGLDPVRREEVAAALVGACVRDGGPARFLYLPAEDATTVRDALGDECLTLFTGITLDLTVRPPGLDGYLAGLSRNRRTSVRREIAEFEASGAQVTVHRLDEVREEIVPLYANLLAKYGGGDCLARADRYLARQSASVAGHSVVWLCRRDGAATAFSLFYRFGAGLASRFVGFDYPKAHTFEYFNLLFYRPVQYAVEHGLRTVHLGVGTSPAKLARGAAPRPLWSVLYRPGGFPVAVRRAAREHNRAGTEPFLTGGARHARPGAGVTDPGEWTTLA